MTPYVRNSSLLRPALRWLTITTAWTFICVFFGGLVGLGAVVLPPAGVFVIPGLAFLTLLWVLPDDLRLEPSLRLVRRLLVVAIVVVLCLPGYYAISLPGFPWISLRRLALAPLLATVALSLAVSTSTRAHVFAVARKSPILTILLVGYAVSAFLSIPVSKSPTDSISRCVTLILEWYLPAIAVVAAIGTPREIDKIMRIYYISAIVIAIPGFIEFFLHRHLFLDILPEPIRNMLLNNNLALQNTYLSVPIRNGLYRASSVYTVPLSFGEFCALAFPLALNLALHGSFLKKLYGLLLTLVLLFAIFSSGARGAWMAVLASTPIFAAFWFAGAVRTGKRSLTPAIASIACLIFGVAVIGLIAFWGRAHNIVFGDGMSQYSTQGRYDEWYAALPHIYQSPLIGNGFGIGADVVEFYTPGMTVPTLDSSLISVLVEQGLLGFGCFFGMILAAMATLTVIFFKSEGQRRHMAATLCASLVAFLTYRTVLSQVDNQFTLFIFLALTLALANTADEAPEGNALPGDLQRTQPPRRDVALNWNGPRSASL